MEESENKQRETAVASGSRTKRPQKVIMLSEGEAHTPRCRNKAD